MVAFSWHFNNVCFYSKLFFVPVMLGSDGQIWTMGNSEQGQLGRVNEKFAHRGGRRGLMALLRPEMVRVNFRSKISGFKDVWAGSYNTVARTDGDQIVVMGLNNYSQLALPTTKGLSFFMPYHSKEMTPRSWRNIAIGQHHAICLEEDGKVSTVLMAIIEQVVYNHRVSCCTRMLTNQSSNIGMSCPL